MRHALLTDLILEVHAASRGTHSHRRLRAVPSTGSVGYCFDSFTIEAFRSRIQVGSSGRQRWLTRIELADAISEYLGIRHDRRCRHGAPGLVPPPKSDGRRVVA